MYVAAFVIPATYLAVILPSALSVHTQDKGFFQGDDMELRRTMFKVINDIAYVGLDL